MAAEATLLVCLTGRLAARRPANSSPQPPAGPGASPILAPRRQPISPGKARGYPERGADTHACLRRRSSPQRCPPPPAPPPALLPPPRRLRARPAYRCWPLSRWPPRSPVYVRQQHVGTAPRHRPGCQEGDGCRECGCEGKASTGTRRRSGVCCGGRRLPPRFVLCRGLGPGPGRGQPQWPRGLGKRPRAGPAPLKAGRTPLPPV